MAAFAEYTHYDALGLAELVANGEVAPTELIDAAIDRIEQLNPRLNALVHLTFDEARSAAAGALPEGPFRGVPFVLKDLEGALAGVPMTSGSRMYAGWCPPRNSALVDRFLAAGLVVVGKANTPEFGMIPSTEPELHGPTRNPWNPELTAGGSSGGTAAAVASGMVPCGSGGDGGGSIRIPSACCGLFGLKPTRGRTPNGPDQAEAWNGFSLQFALTKSVRDAAALLDAVTGPFLGDWHSLPPPETPFRDEVGRDPGRLRIAFSAEPFVPATLHADCQAGLAATVAKLEALGHELVEARPALDGRTFARRFLILLSGQIGAAVAESGEAVGRRPRRRDFEDRTWLVKVLGDNLSAADYAAALRGLQQMVRPVHTFFEDYDVYLCPTLGAPPPPLGFLDPHGLPMVAEKLAGRLPIGKLLTNNTLFDQASSETFAFIPNTPVFNVTGQPSMSVPTHWNDEGVPVGMMFSAGYGNEAVLFRLAAQLEAAHPWMQKLPPL